MSDVRTPDPAWFSDEEFEGVRRRLPLLYVEAVPVRLDDDGFVTEVGLLIRVDEYGEMRSALVAGRVKFGESVRDALSRNLEKDLGALFPVYPTALSQQRSRSISHSLGDLLTNDSTRSRLCSLCRSRVKRNRAKTRLIFDGFLSRTPSANRSTASSSGVVALSFAPRWPPFLSDNA